MWDTQFYCLPQFNNWFLISLRPIHSLLYLTTVCRHLLSVLSINMRTLLTANYRGEVTTEIDER